MENQHKKIKGYRDLTQLEIDLMNEIKMKGLELEALLNKATKHHINQRAAVLSLSKERRIEEAAEEELRLNATEPERWTAISKTHLQEGLMALTRSIAQPSFF